MRFSVFGIELEISFLFFVILALGFVADEKGILYLLLFSTLHELGHIAALYLLGGRVDKITVSYYGIGMSHSSNLSVIKEIIFLMSGVLINYFFAAFKIQREINLALGIINSLPVYPLDAGRITKLLLDELLPIGISYKVYIFIAWIFEIVLIAYAIFTKSINLILICIYLFFGLIRGNV